MRVDGIRFHSLYSYQEGTWGKKDGEFFHSENAWKSFRLLDFSDPSAANDGQRTPLPGARYGQSWRTLDYRLMSARMCETLRCLLSLKKRQM